MMILKISGWIILGAISTFVMWWSINKYDEQFEKIEQSWPKLKLPHIVIGCVFGYVTMIGAIIFLGTWLASELNDFVVLEWRKK